MSEVELHNERLLLQQRLNEVPPLSSATRDDYKKYLLGIADVSPLITVHDIARWLVRSPMWVYELLREARRERDVLNNIGAGI